MPIDAPLSWRVDLHVHTRRYSPCAESLDPALLPEVMTQCGLHGVVITEHDQLWSRAEIAELNRRLDGARIFGGVEVSSRNGHFLVIGLDRMGRIEPGIPVRQLIREARAQGAAVIWAHPQLKYSQIERPLEMLCMPDGIDAIEVASTVTLGPQAAEARDCARKMGCTMVGGSDAHSLAQVGKAFTRFNEMPADEKELAQAIRNGHCTATYRDDEAHMIGREEEVMSVK